MRSSPADYELREATELEAALQRFSDGSGWRPMSGGTDLMVLFNAGVLPFRRLVSIRGIRELSEISVSGDGVRIGAGATYASIQRHDLINREFFLLSQAANWTGSPANQNRGTLGGNIANGSPAADSPPALLVYNAELELVSLAGTRRVPYSDFHLGYKKMRLNADELISAIYLPRTGATFRQYCRKVGARKAQAISKVSFHGVAEKHGNAIRDIRIALGSVAPVPLRCSKVEHLLKGQVPTMALIQAARGVLLEEIGPIDDIRSTATYRYTVSQNLLGEFLEGLA
jgi:CO/xanthine dehydrogenase FAD-binding subunit